MVGSGRTHGVLWSGGHCYSDQAMSEGPLVLLLMSAVLGVIGLSGHFRTATGRFTKRSYWLLGGLILCAVLGAGVIAREKHRTRVLLEQQRENSELRDRISKELSRPRK